MGQKEKELKKLYTKYIKNKFFYRTISNEYLLKLNKTGLNPKENPFPKTKKQLNEFFNLIKRLHTRGYILKFKGPYRTRTADKVSEVMQRNLKRSSIDLSPAYSYNYYYLKMKGGTLVSVVKYFAEEIIKKEFPISNKEKILVKNLIKWCKNKQKYNVSIIKISRTNKQLETAQFNRLKGKFLSSPFGSYEHFKKIILKQGWKKYEQYINGQKRFYLRLNNKIPSKDLIIIKK